jgi:membrane glycosyltransferase
MEKLTAVVSLLVALSVAAERLVEIVKGMIPRLNLEHADPKTEAWRRCCLQLMAILAGIVTVYLSRRAIPAGLVNLDDVAGVFALGLLASGGSGFWNSILTYVAKVKEVKEAEVVVKRQDALAQAGASNNEQTAKTWLAVAQTGKVGG